jgi:hypothetical protein
MCTATIPLYETILALKTMHIVPLNHHEKDTLGLPRRIWHSYVRNVEMNWERI